MKPTVILISVSSWFVNVDASAVPKRSKDGILCNIPEFNPVNAGSVVKAIDILRGEAGTSKCSVAYGQHKCTVAASAEWAEIYVCNDNDSDVTVQCDDVASFAVDILNKCQSSGRVQGQWFDTDGWNVVVGY